MMNKKMLYALVGLALPASLMSCAGGGQQADVSYTDYVDPFIGTDGHGHVFLGANVPFGMVQLGPSQTVKGWDWCSGYHYSDSTLLGFSHTHLSGTGIGDLGDVLLMPATDRHDDMSAFSHDREECRPGYYKVYLDDSRITAELTATARTGFHRYTFPADADTAYIRLNLLYGIGWDSPVESRIEFENDSTVSGYRYSAGWARNQKVYFTAEFSRPIIAHEGDNNVAVLAFDPSPAPLTVKVGLSAVSVENAHLNLNEETAGRDFDMIAEAADKAWNAELSKIKIDTDNEADRQKFYTALYHTMFAPAIFCDVNGDYRGADGNIHTTGGNFTNYTIFSLWDTYRAAHPLSTIIHDDMQADYADTFINIYRQQGKLPVWHLHGNETDCMIGNPGVIVLGDLLSKGFVADSLAAYEAMKASCMLDERSMFALKQYGYVPFDAKNCQESVAKGLEYAIADNAVALAAASLGLDIDKNYFEERAKSYRHYFDPALKFMRGKSTAGTFRNEDYSPFATSHRADDYCEGNGWQYVWLVPHDPHGLIDLFGSEELFIGKLDSLFTVEGSLGDDASPDISGLIGQYAHGNEPSHHTVYLYNYAGRPHKAAPILRRIMNDLYTTDKTGLCGNEDVGQMSAWFVMSSIGLYQVEPTGGRFVFGSPLFKSATIDVGHGKTLKVNAINNSPENIYIQSVTLNGEPYGKSYIDFAQIKEGGVLEFVMGSSPAPDYGTAPESRP